MTRKLTDEQVKAIKKLRITSGKLVIISHSKNHDFLICKMNKKDSLKNYWYISSANLPVETRYIETADEAIAYAEHLLNQRYQWLPQNNGWIMSGVVYNFANGGANKVWELIHIAEEAGFAFGLNAWFKSDCKYTKDFVNYYGCPTAKRLVKGISIDPDSPIWDAVKGVE
jgi:hypothetical protein